MSLIDLDHSEIWECLYAEYLKEQVISYKALCNNTAVLQQQKQLKPLFG